MEEGLIHLNQSLTANLEEVGASFWEHRPFWAGGDVNLVPTTTEEVAADLWWHIGTTAALSGVFHMMGFKHHLGPLQSVNLVMGDVLGLYRPGQVVQTARATHVTGSAMSLSEAGFYQAQKRGAWKRWVFRASRFAGPLGGAVLALEIIYMIPPSGENSYKPKQLGPTEFVPQNSFEW